jgi:hypothetical protein
VEIINVKVDESDLLKTRKESINSNIFEELENEDLKKEEEQQKEEKQLEVEQEEKSQQDL